MRLWMAAVVLALSGASAHAQMRSIPHTPPVRIEPLPRAEPLPMPRLDPQPSYAPRIEPSPQVEPAPQAEPTPGSASRIAPQGDPFALDAGDVGGPCVWKDVTRIDHMSIAQTGSQAKLTIAATSPGDGARWRIDPEPLSAGIQAYRVRACVSGAHSHPIEIARSVYFDLSASRLAIKSATNSFFWNRRD